MLSPAATVAGPDMYEAANANKTFGHQSAHAASIALNPGGVATIGNATGVISLGVMRAPMPTGKARLVVRASAAYGAGETLAILLRWQAADGTTETPTLVTLGPANITGAGEFTVVDGLWVGHIPPGSVVSFSNTYVAGAAADPNVSLALQLY